MRPPRPDVPRTKRGLRIVECHLFDPNKSHGGHRYIRGGDETVCCPGRQR